MKGQYRVINELLLFGIGAILAISIAIATSYIINPIKINFQREQYYLVANLVSLATTKSYLCSKLGDCELEVDIPAKLSEDFYTISLDQNKITISNFRTKSKISLPTIYLEKNMKGYATSSGRYFIIRSVGDNIILSKW